jgi:hypothetical protein
VIVQIVVVLGEPEPEMLTSTGRPEVDVAVTVTSDPTKAVPDGYTLML